jgi:hypothetical protein
MKNITEVERAIDKDKRLSKTTKAELKGAMANALKTNPPEQVIPFAVNIYNSAISQEAEKQQQIANAVSAISTIIAKNRNLKDEILSGLELNGTINPPDWSRAHEQATVKKEQQQKIQAQKALEAEADRKLRMSMSNTFVRWFTRSRYGSPEGYLEYLAAYPSQEIKDFLSTIQAHRNHWNELLNNQVFEAERSLQEELDKREQETQKPKVESAKKSETSLRINAMSTVEQLQRKSTLLDAYALSLSGDGTVIMIPGGGT